MKRHSESGWLRPLIGWSVVALLFYGASSAAGSCDARRDAAEAATWDRRWEQLRDLGMSSADADDAINQARDEDWEDGGDDGWERFLYRTAKEGPLWPSKDRDAGDTSGDR